MCDIVWVEFYYAQGSLEKSKKNFFFWISLPLSPSYKVAHVLISGKGKICQLN